MDQQTHSYETPVENTKDITPSHGHGGQLTQASKDYGIPLENWLDLSTGISPFVYPLPNMPVKYWQRLPETNDGLETAARDYYGSDFLLPVSGSQEAIQKLPFLFTSLFAPKHDEKEKTPLKVGLIAPAYHSHQHAWEKEGHQIVLLHHEQIEDALNHIDVLLLVNPTNPSCHSYPKEDLLKWHQKLVGNNGYLIVDEAFMDCTPENTLIEEIPRQGLIVLRSIGKFFGLAGIRLGFVWAEPHILQHLLHHQDDWAVSNPARWAGKLALEDKTWQQEQKIRVNKLGLRLSNLLTRFLASYISPKSGEVDNNINEIHNFKKNSSANDIKNTTIKHTPLFCYFEHPDAKNIHQKLAKQGILTRLFLEDNYLPTYLLKDWKGDSDIDDENKTTALRLGLPENEEQWLRLENALDKMKHYTIVESFDISQRGVVVALDAHTKLQVTKAYDVKIITPCGKTSKTQAFRELLLKQQPHTLEKEAFLLKGLTKEDVPKSSILIFIQTNNEL